MKRNDNKKHVANPITEFKMYVENKTDNFIQKGKQSVFQITQFPETQKIPAYQQSMEFRALRLWQDIKFKGWKPSKQIQIFSSFYIYHVLFHSQQNRASF